MPETPDIRIPVPDRIVAKYHGRTVTCEGIKDSTEWEAFVIGVSNMVRHLAGPTIPAEAVFEFYWKEEEDAKDT